MVVCEQLTALIAFMEEHRDLALGNLSRSTEGRMLSKKLWANCAQILNNTAGGGPTKSAAEWRTFYNEYKAKTLKKIKLKRREICAPGEIPVKRIVITPLQERLYKILRNPQVQEEPLLETSSHCQQTPSICGWESSSRCQQTPPRFNTFVDIKAQKVESPSGYKAPCACKPPRQRPRIDGEPVEEGYNDSIESAQTSLEAAQATLERIENSYARAISEQAQATNRLAAAIEDVAHGRVATALEHIASSLATYVQTVKAEPESGSEE
ncbi:uncharacterized protein LOC121732223 isoform X2 [Aricia agestis]|uniref:uncharacterized protein LOC121732223 isoform X2 n=1 Tax=Aricia agestis TaxID=91739 RepID=UPI001C204E64|nr:uncharacterized protein LOC121732223 isoform X2 [Aricia agestis]